MFSHVPNLTCIFGVCRTYVRMYVHTYIRTYVHTYVRTYIRTHVRTYIHTPNMHVKFGTWENMFYIYKQQYYKHASQVWHVRKRVFSFATLNLHVCSISLSKETETCYLMRQTWFACWEHSSFQKRNSYNKYGFENKQETDCLACKLSEKS